MIRSRFGQRPVLLWAAALLTALSGCTSTPPASNERVPADPTPTFAAGPAPTKFRIVPDDYHVPYAGTAQDGRKFFLTEELFDAESAYVGLFLWKADGTFAEVKVDKVPRPAAPPGQAAPAGADELVAKRLAELGKYVLGPIQVEPFTKEVAGVTFGWVVDQFDGVYSIHIEPGNFISYHQPWDGQYDT